RPALPYRPVHRQGGTSIIGDRYANLAPEQGRRLRELAQQHHLTVNTLAQAAWALVLRRYSGLHDVLFGVTVAGRRRTRSSDCRTGDQRHDAAGQYFP
ncbi:condensation domain-containing protein, partial [Pseudomonas aeruginosa]|uniref:condensation domain-containing protein n=1 Tax=Pseudomonas aeruginosa TaxID=287 RepID=UPI0031B7023E